MALALNLVVTVLLGFAATDFLGYFMHVLLHSNKIRFLSNGHMVHHLKLYGPKDQQLSKVYKTPTANRASIAGYGMEWVVPVVVVAAAIFAGGFLLGVPFLYQIVFFVAALSWGIFLFDHMHTGLHLKGFWMEKNNFLKGWFSWARKLHFIHHKELSNDGRMGKNYGICFFIYDRSFGTFSIGKKPFNRMGYKASMKRYSYLFKN